MTLSVRAVVCSFSAIALLAQRQPKPQQQPQSQPQTTFKTHAEVVLVDFIVRDKADRSVRGLSAKDFVVKEDGKERPIVSFTAFDGVGGGGDLGSPSDTQSAETRPSASASAPAPRPATVLLIDDGHLSPRQAAEVRPALKSILATAGQGSGAISLVAPWSKVSVAGILPRSEAEFNAGIDKIVGQRFEDFSSFPIADAEALAIDRGDSPTLTRVARRFVALNPTLTEDLATGLAHNRAVEVAHDVRRRRGVLYGVMMLALNWLSEQPGRHSLVMVSPGFAREVDDRDYHAIVTRSMRVNAPIHFVDVRGLQGVGLQSVRYGPALGPRADATPFAWAAAAEGPSTLADDTGGLVFHNSNDIEKGIGRMIESMSTYYILGYEAPSHDKPGFKKITVESNTRGLRIRARRGYFVDPPPPR
jgi:VWFA-related protein